MEVLAKFKLSFDNALRIIRFSDVQSHDLKLEGEKHWPRIPTQYQYHGGAGCKGAALRCPGKKRGTLVKSQEIYHLHHSDKAMLS